MQYAQLDRARALARPTRPEILRRDPAVASFWHEHRNLLRDAWTEWEQDHANHLPVLDETLFDADLRHAVNQAWESPEQDAAVRDLWKPVAPGVLQCRFFDPQRLDDLRTYLAAVAQADIPLRPPYGIVLNRQGAMLDQRSAGFLAAPRFQALYTQMMTRYFRPIARLLFPEVTGYDTQSFGFSIEYQPTTDTSIRPHTDAAAATLNINLNLPDESFGGSVVDFYIPGTRKPVSFTFEPGVAVIHRGTVPHAAHPITQGQRTNLVLWLYGDGGQMPPRGTPVVTNNAEQRWSDPGAPQDTFAPF